MLFLFRIGLRATYMALAGDLVPAGTTLVTPALQSRGGNHFVASVANLS